MKKNQLCYFLISAVLFFGLLAGMAWADNSYVTIYKDGQEVVSAAPPPPASIEQLTSTAVYEGTGTLSDEILRELEQQPGIITTTPDGTPFEDVIPMTPNGPSTESMESVEAVMGTDTRFQTYTGTYPSRAVVWITMTGPGGVGSYSCSGTMIGPDRVLTAAHCVYHSSVGGWFANFTIYPGRNGASSPWGSTSGASATVLVAWQNLEREYHDYAIIRTASPIGNTVGWLGVKWKSGNTAMKNFPTIIAGYPGDKDEGTQWIGADKVRACTARKLFYWNDTASGMSGSGIWFDNKNTGTKVIGVHAYRDHGIGYHAIGGHGPRITETVFNNIFAW